MSDLYWGEVSRINDDGVFVTVPRVALGFELGPVVVANADIALDVAVGQSVVVGLVAGSLDDVVILGRRP